MRCKIFLIVMAIFFIAGVSAIDLENQQRLDFGHVIIFNNLSTMPQTLEPGVPGMFRGVFENTGNSYVNDIRIGLTLPDEIGFFNDVSNKKTSRLLPSESASVNFNLIALPGTAEGIYNADLTVGYVDKVGEEREDVYVISFIVKSKPKMYVQIEESEVYKGKNLGEITVKFVNNDVADFKFLTSELMNSEQYEILSPKKVYVGDLDSDDFESVDYRIKIKGKGDEVLIPLKITYKDAMNNPFSEEVSAILTLHSGKDLGKVKSKTTTYVIVGLIVVGVGWWFWKRWKKKKRREKY
jgi:LPXTG-motif cell wall-anchored protein